MEGENDERIEAASQFLLQSPPGEINDVLNDVRAIIADDEALESGVAPALRQYNIAQFITVDVPNHSHQVIISEAGLLPHDEAERFLDPRSKSTFRFNHMTLEASDPEPFESNRESEPFRTALEAVTLKYVAAHFFDGVATVFAVPDANDQFRIQVVANKYNPTNFWETVTGKVQINVHYYEQGNVQLSTDHTATMQLPSSLTQDASSASKILALIEVEEGKYQASMKETYHQMSERGYKSLRRTLPITRQKIDWDKVAGYKLGAELTASRGGGLNTS